MSKIGRKFIVTDGVDVAIKDSVIHYKGKANAGTYELPSNLAARLEEGRLYVIPAMVVNTKEGLPSSLKEAWGLHRALLASRIAGAAAPFERPIKIVGLGYKAIAKGDQLEFSLGYSHKILFPLPKGVTVAIDKTGQKLLLSSSDRELVGHVASQMRALRRPEPYKGTGVLYDGEKIRRKAGKKG